MAEPIHFVCPSCSAEHKRGHLNGVSGFRCLRCGYVGHGHHPDHDIDIEVEADLRAAEAWDRAHGIDAPPAPKSEGEGR